MIVSRKALPSVLFGGDILTFLITFLIGFTFLKEDSYQDLNISASNQEKIWLVFVIVVILWILIGYFQKLYSAKFANKISLRLRNYIKAYVILIGLIFISSLLLTIPSSIEQIFYAVLAGFPILGITINFLLFSLIIQTRTTDEGIKYTLVAGVGNLAKNVEETLFNSRKATRRRIKGFIKCKKEECLVGTDRVVGEIKDLNNYLKDNKVDEIIIALPVKYYKKIRNIISAADYHGVRVKYIPDFPNMFGNKYKIMRYEGIDAIHVRQMPLDETYAFALKNTFDKIFSLFALIFLSPLFLILAVLIKIESPGPVFYCPIRVGKSGVPFKLYKFRSMVENDNASNGVLSTRLNDPRVTKFGRIMRKYSLDELPQFMNVLLGDMSVVGPRPHRRYLEQKFQETEDKYMVRHYFKPGITGWAQVNGWRGPTDTDEQKRQRTLHDLWYFENWSFWLDIKIIFFTVFSRKAHKMAF